MAGSIGGISVLVVSGNVDLLEARLETFDVKGFDGHGFREEGKRSEPQPLQLLRTYVNGVAADAGDVVMKGLVGTIGIYVSERGISYSDIVVTGVRIIKKIEPALVVEAGASPMSYPIQVTYEVMVQKRI